MSDYYTDSILTNGGAETGTTGWTASSASSIAGGTAGTYCFKVDAAGSLLQSKTPNHLPNGAQIIGKFLPQYPQNDENDATGKIEISLNYSDSTHDINYISCAHEVI